MAGPRYEAAGLARSAYRAGIHPRQSDGNEANEKNAYSYYFTDYYQNKLSLSEGIQDRGKITKFKNAIKIYIETKEVITSKEVFSGLKKILDKDFRSIKTCMQYKSNKVWIVSFVESFDSSSLLDQTIFIANIECRAIITFTT